MGLLRSLEQRVAQPKYRAPLAWRATAIIEGGGSNAPARARDLASLGYETLLFADSDRDLDPGPDSLRQSGVTVIMWDESVSTEERICRDAPLAALQGIIDLAATIKSASDVRTLVSSKLPRSASLESLDIQSWMHDGFTIEEIRLAVASAAMAGERPWFKRIDTAEELGHVLASHWDQMIDSDLSRKIEEIYTWAYAA